MSSNSHIIDVFFDRLDERFDQVPHVIAETAIEHFKRNFETESFDGKPWQPLSPAYEAKKTRGRGRILTQSGILKGSIHASIVEAGKVIISAGGAKVPYARVHNEGLRAVITPVRYKFESNSMRVNPLNEIKTYQ